MSDINKMVKDSHYRSLSLVGEGQFGKVYSAIHRQTGELVALKELNPQKFSTKKLLREMRILLTLEHSNIVRCQGIEHNSQGRYLVTEYCEGGTLRDLLETPFKISIAQKLKIITDILDGLNHAHKQGIIHRDLKPENIILSITPQGWNGKISDFGVAKIELEDKDINISNMGDTGSPAYMAPEQFYGKYSYSSDLYSIGIIFYELLMGYRPFSGSPYEIMIGHINQTPKFPKDLPPSLRLILMEALQKLPQHRFRTAQEMKDNILESTLKVQTKSSSLYDIIPHQEISFNLVYEKSIEENITLLAVKNNLIYQATSQGLIIENYQEDSNKISVNLQVKYDLNQQIINLQTIDSGCIIATRDLSNFNKYSLFYSDSNYQEIQTLIKDVKSEYFIYSVAKNNQWFAITRSCDETQGFEIIKTQNLSPVIPIIKDFLPQQIVNIDSAHGVTIYTQSDIEKNQTFFRFFNRRGNWYDTYSVPLNLHPIVDHYLLKKTFLTREKQSNNLVLIKFKPFSIRRIPLNFRADFWLPSDSGFICASQSGNIAFLSLNGDYLGEFDLDKIIVAIAPCAFGIAPLKENKIIVITENKGKQTKEIYQINHNY